ncbi:glycosyltransferase [Labilibaculum sp. DW002]|uniref:Glycosyltransferase n=1 Tax=Paralabilibaculum antarcticum TaxID=2912572 RepID=A0ABT5VYE6_9BACT|nr:glycosyltransferase [Labilibaculum sp. DW002]MDE5419817.1 glycosyltransferase [Labilibaculum sp. DW002]
MNNSNTAFELTIVVPVFNEEDNLERVKQEFDSYLSKSPYRSKVLFVNDGSSDNSQMFIESICKSSNKYSYLQLSNNMGLSAALKAGIDYANTEFVGYIDSDLQTTPFDFDLLMEYRHDYALVTGVRQNRKDSFVKNMSSKIANGFRRYMTKDTAEDTGCPLKIMKTDYAKKIPFFTGMHRFIPALIMLQDGKIKQVPVQHFPRIAGEAKYHLFNRMIGPFKDCFAYRWMKKRYINYEIINQG